MTKQFIFVATLALSLNLFSINGFSEPQETSGGDIEALRFVKMGLLLAKEMETNKKCPLSEKTSYKKFLNRVDSMEVESGMTEVRGDHRYVFDRTEWFVRNTVREIQKVFEVYSGGVKVELPDIKACMTSAEWIKIPGPEAYDHKTHALDVKADATQISEELVSFLKTNMKSLKVKDSVIQKMSDQVKSIQFSVTQIAMPYKSSTLKDGVNQHLSRSTSHIAINEATWATLSRGQKMEFLYHEYLGLLRLDDKKYQFSSRIFFLIDAKKYSS